MTIRFILEVPRANLPGALRVIDAFPGAEAIAARHVDSADAEQSSAEISVIAQNADIVDALYEWYGGLDRNAPIFVNFQDGERCRLSAYDAHSLRETFEAHRDDVRSAQLAPPVQITTTRAGNSVYEVPFGGRMSDGPALISAASSIKLERFEHIALRVFDLARAERFYHTFFGMDIVYRAYRKDDRWEQLDETFDWSESVHTGIQPEIVRLENGPVALVLIDAGLAQPLYENRIDHISVVVSPEVLAEIRGKALFHSFTVREDGQRAFTFVDPFGLVWQLIAEQDAAIEAGLHGAR